MTTQAVPSALVCDDNLDSRYIFRLALGQEGYEIVEASNGVECLDRLKDRKFSLLVLDLNMPNMNGIEVLAYLNAKPDLKPETILVVTANPHMVTPQVDEATLYVMYKPVSIPDLMLLLSRVKPAAQLNKPVQ